MERRGCGPTRSRQLDPEQIYKAAGVLFLSLDADLNPVVLLAQERRDGRDAWIDIGGRREVDDTSALMTAQRELSEETGGQLALAEEQVVRKLWCGRCKYVLFLAYLDLEAIRSYVPTETLPALQWFKLEQLLFRTDTIEMHDRLRRLVEVM